MRWIASRSERLHNAATIDGLYRSTRSSPVSSMPMPGVSAVSSIARKSANSSLVVTMGRSWSKKPTGRPAPQDLDHVDAVVAQTSGERLGDAEAAAHDARDAMSMTKR